MCKEEKPKANCATEKERGVGEVGIEENLEKREAWGHLKGPRTAGDYLSKTRLLSLDRNLYYNVHFSLKPVVKFDSGVIQC